MVTITAGGNDLQFAPAMLYAAWSYFAVASPIIATLRERASTGIPTTTPEQLGRADRGLSRGGHAVGSIQPWVFGFESSIEKTGRSFHPNERGTSAVANALVGMVSERDAKR